MGSGEAREGVRNGRRDGEMHKAGGLGVSGERKPRKVKERCFKKLLSTSDWMGSTFLHFLKATFFFFPNRVITSCMASLYLSLFLQFKSQKRTLFSH